MKISKLFHWLYAILLLLPIAIFLPNGLYYAFNEHATAQEKTKQEPIYYESNEINTIQDIHVNNIYYYENNYIGNTPTNDTGLMFLDVDFFKVQFQEYKDIDITEVSLNIRNTGPYIYLFGPYISLDINSVAFDFIPTSIRNSQYLEQYLLPYIVKSTYKYVKEYENVTYSMSIVDSMAFAWQDTWQLPIFNWSYNSFLNAPIQYLGNLFGVPQNSPILAPMSYWLAISVIWLVFDLIMYVPLLAHRWIDKARLE